MIISAIVSNGALIKAGTGTLTLNGPNTYTGVTTINNGVLRVANETALGTTAAGTAVTTGNALELVGGINVGAEALTLIGTGVGSGGALRNVSGNNSWGGAITLSGATRINSDAGTLTIDVASGNAITGTAANLTLGGAGNVTINDPISTTTGTFTKDGTGTATLNSANTYSGLTTVNGGVLLLNNANALPGGIGTSGGTSALTINGGVVGLGAGDFTRNLGTTGTTNVQFGTSGGGFAAFGANRAVNLGGSSAQVTWNVGSFVASGDALILGASGADATVDFQNPISFTTLARTVQVDDGSAAVDAILSGVLSSTSTGGGLTKIGNGTLSLTAANTYSGVTTVSGGVLLLSNATALPGGIDTAVGAGESALTINGGGVLGLGIGDFSRSLGTTAGLVQFGAGGGGFAAYGADRIVNLGGASALVTWNTGSFVPTGSALIFGAGDAFNTVTFQNPIAFGNNATRTVQVKGGAAVFTGALSGTGTSGLVKTGPGTLDLRAASTYSGATVVSNGTLRANNSTGSATGTNTVTVHSGGAIGGTGTFSGTITLNSGSTVSPGNSPGNLNTGSEIWNGGANYLFEINQAGGTEGTDPGWDLLNITGGLTISVTSGNKFMIDIRSLTLANTPGDVSDFNNGLSYDWRIVKTTTGITGFDATVFELLLAGFNNDLGGGTFSMGIANANKDLILSFNPSPVPEASTYLLLGFGLLILGSAWRKRRA